MSIKDIRKDKKEPALSVFLLFAFILTASLLVGCSGIEEGGESAVESGSGSANTSGVATERTQTINESAYLDDPDAIVDLTVLSSTMVYGEVYNITVVPEQYEGRTMKVVGTYTTNTSEDGQQHYHYIVIKDATACCAQGLEFIWTEEHNVPNDYPAVDAAIELTGVYKSYEENGRTRYYIAVDNVKVL